MHISYIAMNRMMEDQLAREPRLRKRLNRQGRGVLSDGRAMSDAELLEKLRSFNVEIDRPRFEELARGYLSAEEMSRALLKKNRRDLGATKTLDLDRIGVPLGTLAADLSSLEMIDEKMQLGYQMVAEGRGDVRQACQLWLEAWNDIQRVMQRRQLRSFRAFDNLFNGTQSLFNWVQDLETELHNAGVEDPKFFRERISLCRTVLERFPHEDELLIQNFKRGLADSYFQTGDPKTGDQLYGEWLAEDPRWGWGWIGWSDNYFLFAPDEKNVIRATELLHQGLETSDVADRAELLDRLADLYVKLGRDDDAELIREELSRLPKVAETTSVTMTDAAMQLKMATDHGDDEIPLEDYDALAKSLHRESRPSPEHPSSAAGAGKPRVGRNAPCPCGSGKKFKKCCWRK